MTLRVDRFMLLNLRRRQKPFGDDEYRPPRGKRYRGRPHVDQELEQKERDQIMSELPTDQDGDPAPLTGQGKVTSDDI